MSDQVEGLVLGDRMNWPFVLVQAVINYQNTIVKVEGEQSEQEVREAATVIRNLIPNAWIKKDKEFRKEIKNSVVEVKIDDREIWCGVPIGKFDPKTAKTEKKILPHRLVQACVNVFNRRGLLSKTMYIEKMVPDPIELDEFVEVDSKGNVIISDLD